MTKRPKRVKRKRTLLNRSVRARNRSNIFRLSPDWKQVLERNLIQEGYSEAEAKELVALSAS